MLFGITRRAQCSVQFCNRNELELISLYLLITNPPILQGGGGWEIIEILITQAMDDNMIDSNTRYEGDLRLDMLTKFGM